MFKKVNKLLLQLRYNKSKNILLHIRVTRSSFMIYMYLWEKGNCQLKTIQSATMLHYEKVRTKTGLFTSSASFSGL